MEVTEVTLERLMMDLGSVTREEEGAALRATISPGSALAKKRPLMKKWYQMMSRFKLLLRTSGKVKRMRRIQEKSHGAKKLLNHPMVTRLTKFLKILRTLAIIKLRNHVLSSLFNHVTQILEGLIMRFMKLKVTWLMTVRDAFLGTMA
jgi:hypothetical protein